MSIGDAMSIFTFDPGPHVYAVDGRPIPSVTRVLEDVKIVNYDFIPHDTREMALRRGSDVHLATQLDEEEDLDEDSLSPELLGYLVGWRRFREDFKIDKWDAIERRMYDTDAWFAGTLDRHSLAHELIVDIKTTSAPWWTAVQLAAYKHLRDKELGGAINRRMAVELHKDGTFKAIEYKLIDQRRDFATFVAALRVYSEKARNGH